MKSCLKNAVIITASSATFVWADIDSKRLLQLIYPPVRPLTEMAASQPRLHTPVSSHVPQRKKMQMIVPETSKPESSVETAPILVKAAAPPVMPPSDIAPDINKEGAVRSEEPLIAEVWIRENHPSGGLIISGCDEAVERVYGTSPPQKILCQSKDEGTVFLARSNEMDPFSRQYVWHYR